MKMTNDVEVKPGVPYHLFNCWLGHCTLATSCDLNEQSLVPAQRTLKHILTLSICWSNCEDLCPEMLPTHLHAGPKP